MVLAGFHGSSLHYHDPIELVSVLAERGFGCLAIQPRRGLLDPFAETESFDRLLRVVAEHELQLVIDLDAPFYDDPTRYQWPSFFDHQASIDQHAVSPHQSGARQQPSQSSAAERLQRWIEWIAKKDWRPAALTFSTGQAKETDTFSTAANQAMLDSLVEQLQPLLELAQSEAVRLALRPAAKHAIATVAHFERFCQWLDGAGELGLAADVGEMLLGGEIPIGARLARMQHKLSCVYLCEPEMTDGRDISFGGGDIDFARVWAAISESGFQGPAVFRALGQGQQGLALVDQVQAILSASR